MAAHSEDAKAREPADAAPVDVKDPAGAASPLVPNVCLGLRRLGVARSRRRAASVPTIGRESTFQHRDRPGPRRPPPDHIQPVVRDGKVERSHAPAVAGTNGLIEVVRRIDEAWPAMQNLRHDLEFAADHGAGQPRGIGIHGIDVCLEPSPAGEAVAVGNNELGVGQTRGRISNPQLGELLVCGLSQPRHARAGWQVGRLMNHRSHRSPVARRPRHQAEEGCQSVWWYGWVQPCTRTVGLPCGATVA